MEYQVLRKKKTRKNRKTLNAKVENFLQSIESNDSESEPFSDFKSNQDNHMDNLSNNPYARPTSII